MTNIGLIFKHWPLITVQRSCKVCGDYMTGTACDTRSIYFGSTSVCEGGKEFCMTDLIHDSSGSDKIFKRCFCLLSLFRTNCFTTYSRIVLVYLKNYENSQNYNSQKFSWKNPITFFIHLYWVDTSIRTCVLYKLKWQKNSVTYSEYTLIIGLCLGYSCTSQLCFNISIWSTDV